MKKQYEYFGVCTRVIDGDTIEVIVDLGFKVMHTIRVRLLGVWADEIFSGTADERGRGVLAKTFTEQLLVEAPVMVQTEKDPTSFNRYVATVWINGKEGVAVNANQLITEFLVEHALTNAPKK